MVFLSAQIACLAESWASAWCVKSVALSTSQTGRTFFALSHGVYLFYWCRVLIHPHPRLLRRILCSFADSR
uniref:Putative secreted protein n=1 Tax=Ixodes ricinus TaxID=34613 RepID=A0A6B0U0I6_IXORI